jgi:hypothetical protein
MRFPEPRLDTRDDGDGVLVTARFETPEMARLMESLRGITFVVVALATGASGIWLADRAGFLTDSASLVLAVTSLVVAAVLVARIGAGICHHRRFWLRRLTDRTRAVRLARDMVHVADHSYRRGPALRFTALPHRGGRIEERHERQLGRMIPTVYRDAFQVWLQHGETFVLIADVSDEKGAAAIVRHLQTVDEHVTRGRQSDGGAFAYGRRHLP